MSRILIVEDDQFLRKAYNNVLNKENFEVKVAENGTIALEVAASWKPDLIMLDMLMPGIDGVEFLKRYDAKSKPDVKIIVFSNMSIPEKVNEALQLGAIDYKTKANFTPKEMVNLIRQTLSGNNTSASKPDDNIQPVAIDDSNQNES